MVVAVTEDAWIAHAPHADHLDKPRLGSGCTRSPKFHLPELHQASSHTYLLEPLTLVARSPHGAV